jgi:hypothetical protein
MAYGLGSSEDQSPPMSVTTDTSLEEEDVDELWDSFERRLKLSSSTSSSNSYPLDLSDTSDAPYSSSSSFDNDHPGPHPRNRTTLSVGPNGKPLVVFPVPTGPDVQALLGPDVDSKALQDALLQGAVGLRDGTRAARDLLRAMRLQDVEEEEDEVEEEVPRF